MRKVSRVMSTKEIRGIKFHVESCFNGEKDITEKVADMIKKDFESGAYDEPEEEDSVDWDMDSPAMILWKISLLQFTADSARMTATPENPTVSRHRKHC